LTKPISNVIYDIKIDLVYVKSNFCNLPTSITKLQTDSISLVHSIEVVDSLSVAIKHLTKTHEKHICIDMENVLKKYMVLIY